MLWTDTNKKYNYQYYNEKLQ